MEILIKFLSRWAALIEQRAEALRTVAIARLDRDNKVSEKCCAEAHARNSQEWAREVLRHNRACEALREDAVAAEVQHDERVQANEEKIKRISLS